MPIDAVSTDVMQTGKAMKRAMMLLAVVAVAAAAGLATIDVPEADLTLHVPDTDASEDGETASVFEKPMASAQRDADAELQSSDGANATDDSKRP